MHVKSFRVQNFRRLKDVTVDLDSDTSIFVGANNSGKTSATNIFPMFLGEAKGGFTIHDFNASCWEVLNAIGDGHDDNEMPSLSLDLWIDVDDLNVHRVADLLPDLQWEGVEIGLRLAFQPKDLQQLLTNYREAFAKAREASTKARTAAKEAGTKTAMVETSSKSPTYKPWPHNLVDYLTKRLNTEYELFYSTLNRTGLDSTPEVSELGNIGDGAAKLVESIVRVDFLDAQRNLSDGESRGRYEDLSKRLSRYYARHLTKQEDDFEALSAIAESEERLNVHFSQSFESVLNSLQNLGYPGVGNHDLVIKADLNAATMLSSSAHVHYVLDQDGDTSEQPKTLPDRYNGLGFKNLIFMAIEILDFERSWAEVEENRPPVHLIMIEEPETHLHSQLQQVFIRKLRSLVPEPEEGFTSQYVITTHSAHIIYEKSFNNIRYFCRATGDSGENLSKVKNLSKFYEGEEGEIRNFLLQYLKLTHCDLFFADAVILVEGNVERLLLPMIIDKRFDALSACRLTILEVGGAFASKFDKLIAFLDLPGLVITDLDSVYPETEEAQAESALLDSLDTEEDEDEPKKATAKCPVDIEGALTSNETLKTWIPRRSSVNELLELPDDEKLGPKVGDNASRVRVAYQVRQPIKWREEVEYTTGRTLEEAFALENLAWCQSPERTSLQLGIRGSGSLSLKQMRQKIYTRVNNLDKTRFALALISEDSEDWVVPEYIQAGLGWLEREVASEFETALNESEIVS